MPAREVAAKRYAQAVFALARDTGAFDPWRADLATIAALFADPTVAGYLASSKVPEAEKFVLLQRALPDVQPQALNLARLLVRKRRAALAPGIAEAFGAQLNTERGVAVARGHHRRAALRRRPPRPLSRPFSAASAPLRWICTSPSPARYSAAP